MRRHLMFARSWSVLGCVVICLSALGFSTPQVSAASSGPAVIAVHRDGAVDVPGNGTYGTVAKMSVPAGNWLITATATIEPGIYSALATYCQLVAGSDSYADRTDPTLGGAGSLGAMELLLAHHFAKKGSVTLQCDSGGWTGEILIRDVHVTAVQVGQLTNGDVTYGAGSPTAYFAQSPSTHLYFDSAVHDVQDLSLPAGTWLVQAAAWGIGFADGDRVDCSLASSSATADSFIQDFEDIAGSSIGLEGVVTLSNPDLVSIYCKDTAADWSTRGSAMSAMKVGTLKYGHIGTTLTTSGSGSPTVIGAYSDDAGAVSTTQSLASIGGVSIPSGSWFVTSHVSLLADSEVASEVTCQLQLGGARDQGRVVLDSSNYSIGWLGSSLTKKLSASANAAIACNQSNSNYEVLYLHHKVFAIKAGTLTDTVLD